MTAPEPPSTADVAQDDHAGATEEVAVEATRDEPAPAPSATVPADSGAPETKPDAS
jgi:NADH-quinone oxidoreductase subunit E